MKIGKPAFLSSFPKCERAAFQIELDALPLPNEINDAKVRTFYMKECAKAGRRFRRLVRQIYAAKYTPYLPTEEELKRELNLEDFEKLENL